MGKLLSTVGGGMTAMFGMLQDQFGIDLGRMLQNKVKTSETSTEPASTEQAPAESHGASHTNGVALAPGS